MAESKVLTMNRDEEEMLSKEEKQQMDPKPERPVFGQPIFENQESENVLAVSEFGGKFQIKNNVWTPIARKLWKLYKELQSCNPSTILFVSVDEGKKKFRGRPVVMEISVLSQQLSELFKQMSGFNFTHVIRIYETNAENKTNEQMLVHLYKQMRQIQENGKLRDYDEKEFAEIQANLRRDWDSDGAFIPNIIDCENWAVVKQRKQQSLFDETRASC
jgi:hypothetical protein